MAALPYIQLYVADYLADTAHLTAAQHGAYLLLIFNYWQRGQPLNNANERLTNVARMSNAEWAAAKPVLQEFFEVDGDTWTHRRIERDLEAVRLKSTKASNAGKASASARGNGRSADVQRTFNHTDTNTDTNTDIQDKDIAATPLVISPQPKRPAVPVKEIIDLYHHLLPTCPKVRKLPDARRRQIEARWRSGDLPDLETWRDYFGFCAESKFLRGESPAGPGQRPFVADLEWLSRESNYTKVLEGKYHR